MNNANAPFNQAPNPEFEVDINNFKLLQQENRGSIPGNQGQPTPSEASPQKQEGELPAGRNLNQEMAQEGQDTQANVQNVEDDGNGFFLTGINTHHDGQAMVQAEDMQLIQEEVEEDPVNSFDPLDKCKHMAMVDCSKAFSNQECLLISEKQKAITYLNVSNQISFKFDHLITSHDQVQKLCERLIHKFIYPRKKAEKDKIFLNIADQFNSNNNAGFNLTNFKIKFINQFFQDVTNDYEKSVIGTFTLHLLHRLQNDPKLENYELYFTITKFENDIGFSLIHQEPDQEEGPENQDLNATHQPQFDQHEQPVNEEEELKEEGEQQQDNLISNGDEMQQREMAHEQMVQEVQQQQFEQQQQIVPQDEELNQVASPQQMKEEQMRLHRKAMLTKHGVIPEFIKVSEIYQVYTAFTQANLKNHILHEKQAQKLAMEQGEALNYKETELKEDVLNIQFKLVDKRTYKTANTFSFINMPLQKSHDNNMTTLLEILNKFKRQELAGKTAKKQDFIPYNKSILTRVIAEQLQRNNVLVLSHYSKNSINQHFKHSSGPAKNLFAQIDSLFGDKPGIMTRKKLNDQQALKVLQQKFKTDTRQIFDQLEQFREGAKSIEVYTQQMSSQLPRSMGIKGSVQPTMFQQILQFLSFKDEIIQGHEEGNRQSLYMSKQPNQDIQKVIFDKNYIKFNKQRQQAQEAAERMRSGYNSTIGYASNMSGGGPPGTLPKLGNQKNDPAFQFQMGRLQYECIKTELKEEYDKRVNFLHKRIEKRQSHQGPYQDAHLILMQNSLGDINQAGKRNGPRKFGANSENFSSQDNAFSLPGMKSKTDERRADRLLNLNHKGISGERKRNAFGSKVEGPPAGANAQEKDQYYKFYLDSAQKAIEMMRRQHKSAQLMKLNQDQLAQQQQQQQMAQTFDNETFINQQNFNSQGNLGQYNPDQLPTLYNGVNSNSIDRTKRKANSRSTKRFEPLLGKPMSQVGSMPSGVVVQEQSLPEGEYNAAAFPQSQPDAGMDVSKSFNQPNSLAQQNLGMINEDPNQQFASNKPYSAAHGTRKKLNSMNNQYMMSENRGGASSKQSTHFTGGPHQMRQTGGSYGFKSGTNFNTTVKQRLNPTSGAKATKAPLTRRREIKDFVPLRNEGRIGKVVPNMASHNGLTPSIEDHNPRSAQGKVAKSMQGGLHGRYIRSQGYMGSMPSGNQTTKNLLKSKSQTKSFHQQKGNFDSMKPKTPGYPQQHHLDLRKPIAGGGADLPPVHPSQQQPPAEMMQEPVAEAQPAQEQIAPTSEPPAAEQVEPVASAS